MLYSDPNKKITIPCDYCGKKKTVYKRQIEHLKHHFCNRRCRSLYIQKIHLEFSRRKKTPRTKKSYLPFGSPYFKFLYNKKQDINPALEKSRAEWIVRIKTTPADLINFESEEQIYNELWTEKYFRALAKKLIINQRKKTFKYTLALKTS